ncbi:hypothetical protein [Sphingomonas sp. C3-2]|uniref:hypothetical protein n=1 Tax=Sphingomonas sp. C3-2 TaxID=3062169 RepID=UPI00294A9F8D|nr:hypothetical protein [Sphingomonas sp. C3-2]WOK35463.1 hypothetical protein QYC26_10590 [Sphingomonas sp. C3-2]
MTHSTASSSPVTIRIPERLLRKIEARAAAAQMSRSAYILARLAGDEPEVSPALAALAQLIAIHATVQRSAAVNPEHMRTLTELVDRLSRLVHREFAR